MTENSTTSGDSNTLGEPVSEQSEELSERWGCHNCGHTETALFDDVAGRQIKKTVGQGRRESIIQTAVCPECYSEDWHSESVSKALLGHDIPHEDDNKQ